MILRKNIRKSSFGFGLGKIKVLAGLKTQKEERILYSYLIGMEIGNIVVQTNGTINFEKKC